MTFDEQAKKSLTVGLFCAVVIFAGVAYWHYSFLKPLYKKYDSQIKVLNGEISKYKGDLDEINQAEKARGEVENMRRIVAEATKRLPSTPDAAGFYQELIRILRITGVLTTRVEPGGNRAQPYYTEIPYGIQCQCRYHEFGQFLNLIEENQTRFMRVNSFVINNNNNRPSIHPISVNISTFMFNK